MEKVTFEIFGRNIGSIKCKAYEYSPGIYIHKTLLADGILSKKNLWTVSHKSGWAIRTYEFKLMTLKTIVEQVKKIEHLDWNKPKEYILKYKIYGKTAKTMVEDK